MMEWIKNAAEVAKKSTCERAKCGSIIVNQKHEVIGTGYNSPPGQNKELKRCDREKSQYHRKVTDKTCCMHAEQRAMIDALRNHPEQLEGSTIVYARINEDGEVRPSGQPYCTICSKMAVDLGIETFMLKQEDGVNVYDIKTYHQLSYNYKKRWLKDLYENIKEEIIEEGFEDEINHIENKKTFDKEDLLLEIAWTVLSSGMSNKVVRNKFDSILEAFRFPDKLQYFLSNKEKCIEDARKHFDHEGKMNAIADAWEQILKNDFSSLKDEITDNPIKKLQKFDYIGPTTSYHLAKNLGFDVAKPDRHLERIRKILSYSDVQSLCEDISALTDDSVKTVDYVLWRFAEINEDYLSRLKDEIPVGDRK